MSEVKTRVAVVFGGRSGEHGISCATAAGVLGAIDRERFDVVPVGITHEGKWALVEDNPQALELRQPGSRNYPRWPRGAGSKPGIRR